MEEVLVPVDYLMSRLITSCESGNIKEVGFLVRHVPNYLQRFTGNDFNALMSAIFSHQNNIAHFLLSSSVNNPLLVVEDLSTVRNKYESTPLHVACYKMNYPGMQILLAHANFYKEIFNLVNAVDCWGKTPLHHAVYHNNLPAVAHLLSLSDTKVSTRDANGKRAMDYCLYNKPAILEEFYKRGLYPESDEVPNTDDTSKA